jgi:hypothetical protein
MAQQQQGIEVVPARKIMVTKGGVYKIMHDEFFGALLSKAFRGLRVLRCVEWEEDVEQLPFFKRRNAADYLKLTVYLSNVISENVTVDTHFSYLARRVQMERTQQWVRLVITRQSKKRTLAFCMATHPRLGKDSIVQLMMPPDVLRTMHMAHGLLKYISA